MVAVFLVAPIMEVVPLVALVRPLVFLLTADKAERLVNHSVLVLAVLAVLVVVEATPVLLALSVLAALTVVTAEIVAVSVKEQPQENLGKALERSILAAVERLAMVVTLHLLAVLVVAALVVDRELPVVLTPVAAAVLVVMGKFLALVVPVLW